MEMTKLALRDLCVQNKLYRTPYLNEKLYLNFKGFMHIANLDEYINLKALFLEGNALQSLEGMPRLEQLKCLYVHQNCLRSLRGIEQLPNLGTLNISSNGLDSLHELQACPALSTLVAEHNHLSTLEALAPLQYCTNLHTLDLQNNNIEDPAAVDELSRLPELRCLYLKGNPMVSKVQNYRKAVISKCPQLTYLDDRPVTEEERLCCEAWLKGGVEAERAERARIKEEAAARDQRNFEWMQNLRKQGFRKRRAMLGLPDCDTDPFMDTLTSEDLQQLEDNSDDEIEILREPPELVAARQQLAAYSARPGEEEPPELSRARRQLVRQGAPIQEGSWAATTAKAAAITDSLLTGSSDDGAIYLESVKASQSELNAAGSAAAVPASGLFGADSASTVSGSDSSCAGAGMQAARLGADFARLRAATQAALAAAGLSDMTDGVDSSSSSTFNVGLAGCSDASALCGHRIQTIEPQEVCTTEQETAAGDNDSGRPEQLCKVGSWASSSGSDTADVGKSDAPGTGVQQIAEPLRCESALGPNSGSGSDDALDSSPEEENSSAMVALEDVLIAADSDEHLRAAENNERCFGLQPNGLYDLD